MHRFQFQLYQSKETHFSQIPNIYPIAMQHIS
jgi:hypothetical protein